MYTGLVGHWHEGQVASGKDAKASVCSLPIPHLSPGGKLWWQGRVFVNLEWSGGGGRGDGSEHLCLGEPLHVSLSGPVWKALSG